MKAETEKLPEEKAASLKMVRTTLLEEIESVRRIHEFCRDGAKRLEWGRALDSLNNARCSLNDAINRLSSPDK